MTDPRRLIRPLRRRARAISLARPRVDLRWMVLAAAALAGLYGAAWSRTHAAWPSIATATR